MPKKFLTWREWEYNRLLCERKELINNQVIIIKKLNKITKAEYYLAVRQEETANTWDTLSWWHSFVLDRQYSCLIKERWYMSDIQDIVNNMGKYLENYNKLILSEWELDQYTNYFWKNREELQYYQPQLTKARLSGQYYLQLLKELQVNLMKNQADIINIQDPFFKKSQPYINKYYNLYKRVARVKNKNLDINFMYKKFLKNIIEKLSDTYYYKFEIFPYIIKFLMLRDIEVPNYIISTYNIHYYNSINNSSDEEQYLFFSIKLPFLFSSHWGFILSIKNEDNEYRRGPWWKWRTPFEVFFEWTLQKPLNILKELVYGSEHINSYYRWGDHYSVNLKFKDDLHKYENFKFDKNFYTQLNNYRDSYYTNWVGDELGYPGECDFKKDFGTYYYHNSNNFKEISLHTNIDDILGFSSNTYSEVSLDDRFDKIFNKKFEKHLDIFFKDLECLDSVKNLESSLEYTKLLDRLDSCYSTDIFNITIQLANDLDLKFKKLSNNTKNC